MKPEEFYPFTINLLQISVKDVISAFPFIFFNLSPGNQVSNYCESNYGTRLGEIASAAEPAGIDGPKLGRGWQWRKTGRLLP
jgi:hypothetical protein